jgi:uncharacterized protein YjbJ (UPF0337 family)
MNHTEQRCVIMAAERSFVSAVETSSSLSLKGVSHMNEDRFAGTAKNLGGKVEEGIGRAAGDLKTQAEGKAKQVAGDLQDLYGQAKDAAVDAAQVVRQGADDAQDYVRKTIEQRPYTTAVIALAAGFLIGRLGRRDY